MQQDYRNYIAVLRKVFDSQKADNQEVESVIIEEKKKPFNVVNREKKYLKKSFLNYLKKKKLGNLTQSLKHLYEDELNLPLTKINRKSNNKSRFAQRKYNRTNNSNLNRRILTEKDIKQDGMFIWPINHKDFWISSFFGLRKIRKGYSFHYGIDMAAIKGTIVKAAADGRVTEAAYSSGYGNTIVITHDERYKTRYAHLNRISIERGQFVKKGQKIGTVGDTGSVRSSGKNGDPSHLHFEVYDRNKQINPLYALQNCKK